MLARCSALGRTTRSIWSAGQSSADSPPHAIIADMSTLLPADANRVLPGSEVVNHARRFAERFNNLAPGAVRDSKRLIREPQREAVKAAITREAEVFGARLRSPEAMEAFQAFFQKRAPDFSKFD